jgi:Amt family ammonium transporter
MSNSSAIDMSQYVTTDQLAQLAIGVDVGWTLLTCYLVFFMQLGFALVEAGCVQQKDIVSILLKNFSDFGVSGLAYFLIGSGFHHGNTEFIGASKEPWDQLGDAATYANVMNGLVFCSTAITIVSGAVAGRFSFHAYLILSFVFAAFIYPVTAYQIWGLGWLSPFLPGNTWTAIDYAGSGVVHMQGAIVALIACYLVGPRLGRFVQDEKGKMVPSKEFTGSSIVLTALGTLIWFSKSTLLTILSRYRSSTVIVCLMISLEWNTATCAPSQPFSLLTVNISILSIFYHVGSAGMDSILAPRWA